ncbi:hypothetical protein A2U01_0060963, partial [Trifolium medium]|nr:hypothetical protein [Trifolium medium]
MRLMLKNEDLFRTFAFEEGCFGEAIRGSWLAWSVYHDSSWLFDDHNLLVIGSGPLDRFNQGLWIKATVKMGKGFDSPCV